MLIAPVFAINHNPRKLFGAAFSTIYAAKGCLKLSDAVMLRFPKADSLKLA
jgi:hypothetical protein